MIKEKVVAKDVIYPHNVLVTIEFKECRIRRSPINSDMIYVLGKDKEVLYRVKLSDLSSKCYESILPILNQQEICGDKDEAKRVN